MTSGEATTAASGESAADRIRRAPVFAVALVCFASLVVLGLALAILQGQRVARVRAEVSGIQLVIERGRALEKEMLDAESGQRGFLLTRDPAYLSTSEAARARVPQMLDELRRAVADDPAQLARVDALPPLWERKQSELAQTLALARAGDEAGLGALLRSNAGRDLMLRLRAEIDPFLAEEQAAFARRLDRLERDERFSLLLILATLGFALTALALSLHRLRQRNAALAIEARRAETQVAAARSELRATARSLSTTLALAPIVLCRQDRDLRYVWFYGAALGHDADWFIGKSDYGLPDSILRDVVVANKEAALKQGEPRRFEALTQAGDARVWYDMHVEPTRDAQGEIDGIESVAIDITDRKRREQHVRLLMRELAHRSKNTLAVVQALARQTAASAPDTGAFIESFSARLSAFAASHALLVEDAWQGAKIADLIRSQLGHYAELIGGQIRLSGGELTLPADIAQNIGLALHELATNSAKYGALSGETGVVDIAWSVAQGELGTRAATLSWTESGGPPVDPPKRSGFGRQVIEKTIARAVNGKVSLAYPREGLRWSLTFPLKDDGGALKREAAGA